MADSTMGQYWGRYAYPSSLDTKVLKPSLMLRLIAERNGHYQGERATGAP